MNKNLITYAGRLLLIVVMVQGYYLYRISSHLEVLNNANYPTLNSNPVTDIQDNEFNNETVTDETKAVLNNSVAVLPFENQSPNPDDAYFALAIHEEILDQLTKIRDLSPIYRSSVLRYKDTNQSIAEIASALNVETIMKGSVRYADNRMNIAVQLFDASGSNLLWSEEYERELSDVFAVQAEIVERIAKVLEAEISATEKERIEKAPTKSLEAYILYLKAGGLVSHIEASMPPQIYQYLDQAIAVDPNFALAHATKATAFLISHNFGNPLDMSSLDDVEKIAATHTEKAMVLDPNLYFSNMAQAMLHFIHGRHQEAEQTYERALQLGPSSVEVLNMYSHFLSFNGKHDKSIRLAERAQMLTPNDASFHARLAVPLMFAGRPVEAANHFREGLKYYEYPWLHRLLGQAEYLSGNRDEAIKELRISEQIQEYVGGRPDVVTAYTYSLLGLKDDAARLINKLGGKAPTRGHIGVRTWTFANLAIGKVDAAYDILSTDLNGGLVSLQELKSNVMKDPTLEEPRFVELRNRIGSLN